MILSQFARLKKKENAISIHHICDIVTIRMILKKGKRKLF